MVLLFVAGLLVTTAIVLWYLPRKSRMLWKVAGRIASGLLVCASVPLFLAFLWGSVMCGSYEFTPISSPDWRLAAEVTEEDCGATDSFHSSVNVWQYREGLFAHLFGKRAHSTTVFTVEHDPRLIDVAWQDDRTLLIQYPNDYRNPAEFMCQSQWKSIRVECIGYAPDYNKPLSSMPPVQR